MSLSLNSLIEAIEQLFSIRIQELKTDIQDARFTDLGIDSVGLVSLLIELEESSDLDLSIFLAEEPPSTLCDLLEMSKATAGSGSPSRN